MLLVIWICLIVCFYGKANTLTQYACYCHAAQLDCPSSFVSVTNTSYGFRQRNCNNNNQCLNTSCCTYTTDDCLLPIPKEQVLNNSCLSSTSCNISYIILTDRGCQGNQASDYLKVDYECVSASSTSTSFPTNRTDNTGGAISTSATSSGINSTTKAASFPPSTDTNRTISLNTTAGLRTSNPPVSLSQEGSSTTVKQTTTSENTTSTILPSTTSLSTSRVPPSDIQSSPALTSTTLNSSAHAKKSVGEEEHAERLTIILVVVVAVIVAVILAMVFILYRRRCKKPAEEDASQNELPNGLINHGYTSFSDPVLSYKAVETSNYDEMNDESISTYSRPVKKKKDDSAFAKVEQKYGDKGTTDEYDSIEFEKKCAAKMPNYDSVSAIKTRKLDDTYSHISSQSKPVSAPTANEYSHGQFIRKESHGNDHTNKTTITNAPLSADNYSHVDLDGEKTKKRPSNIIEEDSYNHIDLDKTTNPSRNGKAVSGRNIHESEKGSQKLKNDLHSRDVESEGCLMNDGDSGVSSQDPPLQGIKAVSLPDKYIEFKIGDIYDTPRCKDQHYYAVLKDNEQQLFHGTDAGSKRKCGIKENNDTAKDCADSSDYELAKPMDF